MPEVITSLQNSRIKSALRLHSSRGRKQQNRLIIFGRREIERAIASGLAIETLLIATSAQSSFAMFGDRVEEVIEVTNEVMAKLEYGDRGDGGVAIAVRPSTSMEDFAPQGVSTNQLIVVLESIEKPGNLGAILRSIDAVGASGVILAEPMTDFFHPNAIRASTGSVFTTPLATGSNSEVQAWLAHHRFRVFSAMLEESKPLFDYSFKGNTAFVLGNEANGLSPAWRKPQYHSVKLPMKGIADSLNVSVTASVVLYEALRQRESDNRIGLKAHFSNLD